MRITFLFIISAAVFYACKVEAPIPSPEGALVLIETENFSGRKDSLHFTYNRQHLLSGIHGRQIPDIGFTLGRVFQYNGQGLLEQQVYTSYWGGAASYIVSEYHFSYQYGPDQRISSELLERVITTQRTYDDQLVGRNDSLYSIPILSSSYSRDEGGRYTEVNHFVLHRRAPEKAIFGYDSLNQMNKVEYLAPDPDLEGAYITDIEYHNLSFDQGRNPLYELSTQLGIPLPLDISGLGLSTVNVLSASPPLGFSYEVKRVQAGGHRKRIFNYEWNGESLPELISANFVSQNLPVTYRFSYQ